jgi:hypothetical protein
MEDAFSSYLANLNQDQPFMLVGHRQGIMILADNRRNLQALPVLR